MINQLKLKGIAAFMLCVSVALVAIGCGGSGGSGGKTSAANIIKKNGTFTGTVTPTGSAKPAIQAPGQSPLSLSIAMNANNTGTAAFKQGDFGSPDFVTYAADIVNVVITPSGTEGIQGAMSFDMQNFTDQSPYQSLHWSGNYVWNGVPNAGAVITVTGNFTGTKKDGSSTSASFSLNLIVFPQRLSFAGDWTGHIRIPIIHDIATWHGTFTKIDDSHTHASIQYGTTTLEITMVTTNDAIAGDYTDSSLPGVVGHFYLERDPDFNDDNHLIGGYSLLDFGITDGGTISAVKTTSGGGGGGGTLLVAGYYQGTFTPDGGSAKPFKMQINSVAAHTGAGIMINGGGTAGTSVGWKMNQINQGAEGVEVILDNPTQTFQNQLQLEGGVTNNVYTGTYNAGGFETGTFSITKTVLTTTPLAGSYSTSFTGSGINGGTHNVNFTISGNDLTIATSVSGFSATVTGVLVGTSFAGHIPTVDSYIGDWEGTFSDDTHWTGSFKYTGPSTETGTITGTAN